MNAKRAVELMAKDLATAGFELHSKEENANRISYVFVTSNPRWFDTQEMFHLTASKSEYTNRWGKFLSYHRNGFGTTSISEYNITYRAMFNYINWATVKVGA